PAAGPADAAAPVQPQPPLGAVRLEQAQLDGLRDLRGDREVGSRAVVRGPEGVPRAGPYLHVRSYPPRGGGDAATLLNRGYCYSPTARPLTTVTSGARTRPFSDH